MGPQNDSDKGICDFLGCMLDSIINYLFKGIRKLFIHAPDGILLDSNCIGIIGDSDIQKS